VDYAAGDSAAAYEEGIRILSAFGADGAGPAVINAYRGRVV